MMMIMIMIIMSTNNNFLPLSLLDPTFISRTKSIALDEFANSHFDVGLKSFFASSD